MGGEVGQQVHEVPHGKGRERSVDAARVGGAHRVQPVVEGAVHVVLVPVFDVDPARLEVEPGGEDQALLKDVSLIDGLVHVQMLTAKRDVREVLSEVALHLTPVELDVVVAAHDHELAAALHVLREPLEEVLVVLEGALELHDAALGLAAQPELLLLVGDLEGELEIQRSFALGRDHHLHEVDEVSGDDQLPLGLLAEGVEVEHVDEVTVELGVRPLSPGEAGDLLAVASDVHIGDDDHPAPDGADALDATLRQR